MTDRELLLSFIASLTLDEHMGDVSGSINEVLKKMGMGELDWDTLYDLGTHLGKMGVTTLWGTRMGED